MYTQVYIYIYILVPLSLSLSLSYIHIYIIQMVTMSLSKHVCSIFVGSLFIGRWGMEIGRTCRAHDSQSVYDFYGRVLYCHDVW